MSYARYAARPRQSSRYSYVFRRPRIPISRKNGRTRSRTRRLKGFAAAFLRPWRRASRTSFSTRDLRCDSKVVKARPRYASDRRRVIVHLVADRARKIGKLYEPLARAMAELHGRYSDEQLALMVDYTRRGNAIALEHIARVERGSAARDRG